MFDPVSRALRLFDGMQSVAPLIERFRSVIGAGTWRELVASADAALSVARHGEIALDAEGLQSLAQVVRMARMCLATRDGVPVMESYPAAEVPPLFHAMASYVRRVVRFDVGSERCVGSGILLDDAHVLTHVDVLDAVSRGTRAIVVGDVFIRLQQEAGVSTDDDQRVVRGVVSECASGELVVMSVDSCAIACEPLEREQVAPAQSIVVIGHPGPDVVRNPPFVRGILSSVGGVRRVAWGEITAGRGDRFEHDAVTSLGCAGGLILSVPQLRFVGMQVSRSFSWRPTGVAASDLPAGFLGTT